MEKMLSKQYLDGESRGVPWEINWKGGQVAEKPGVAQHLSLHHNGSRQASRSPGTSRSCYPSLGRALLRRPEFNDPYPDGPALDDWIPGWSTLR